MRSIKLGEELAALDQGFDIVLPPLTLKPNHDMIKPESNRLI